MKRITFFTLLAITSGIILSGCTENKDIAPQAIKQIGGNSTQMTEQIPSQTNDVITSPIPKENTMKQFSKAEQVLKQDKAYTAVLHTSKGDITISLNAKETPTTVNNFVFLAKQAFYDKTIFHRVIKGFMIQGGDPEGTGRGGPGYRFDDEPFTGEYTKGTVAMANAGPNTNGSQFFIMHSDTPLPKAYVIFGKVIKGIEVVDAIAEAPVLPSGEGSTPVTPVTVNSVDIIEE